MYITYNKTILKNISTNKIINESPVDNFEFQIDVDTNSFIQNYIHKKCTL